MFIYSRKYPPKDFYVYAYLRSDGSPYYIGKGSGPRAWKHANSEHAKMPKDHSRIAILETGLSEIGALAIERRYIRWYGRKDNDTGVLHNLTEGGEGVCGRSPSMRGKNHSIETKKKISISKKGKYTGYNNPFYGKTHSFETIERIRMISSQKQKGIPKRKACCVICKKEFGHNGIKRHYIANHSK